MLFKHDQRGRICNEYRINPGYPSSRFPISLARVRCNANTISAHREHALQYRHFTIIPQGVLYSSTGHSSRHSRRRCRHSTASSHKQKKRRRPQRYTGGDRMNGAGRRYGRHKIGGRGLRGGQGRVRCFHKAPVLPTFEELRTDGLNKERSRGKNKHQCRR